MVPQVVSNRENVAGVEVTHRPCIDSGGIWTMPVAEVGLAAAVSCMKWHELRCGSGK